MSTITDINPETEAKKQAGSHGHKPRERRCIASGEGKSPENMLRFVLSPEGEVVADVFGKLPGRGVWMTPDRSSLEKALKTGAFARGFKRKVKVPFNLEDQIVAGLKSRILGLIKMARRAGLLESGFDNVRNCARTGELAIRIEARDGRKDGRAKIRVITKAIANELEEEPPLLIGCFDSQELGQVLGRDTLVHAGVRRSALATTLAHESRRLAGFIPLIPLEWPDIAHEAQDSGRM
ncbi:MAG TPA: RNA-binding protein [Hellea balneolensis]|uniref:RNA-binding protein n=1 Tax=Hellea balneolensis TaxID=287478 RepID=A0A7V5NXI0_9PROT|nr:RNA-binding protein [Hellea balneolensis]